MRLLVALLCLWAVSSIYARDVGVIGETYVIAEMDFLDFIQTKVATMQQSGRWQSLQNHVQQEAVRYRDRPKKVDGMTRALETKKWTFDPSIVLNHDLITPDGKLIARAGTSVNPLHYVPLSKTLIFYNGDDVDQVAWVLAQDKKWQGNDKLILVDGSVLAQEKRFKKAVYFDQAGRLTARFHIQHVPATVVQAGADLTITEVSL